MEIRILRNWIGLWRRDRDRRSGLDKPLCHNYLHSPRQLDLILIEGGSVNAIEKNLIIKSRNLG